MPPSLQVRGSQGTLRVDNRNPLGITEHGTSVPICPETQADRYRDAHRELFRHFLRTLKGGGTALAVTAGVALDPLSAKSSLGGCSSSNGNFCLCLKLPKEMSGCENWEQDLSWFSCGQRGARDELPASTHRGHHSARSPVLSGCRGQPVREPGGCVFLNHSSCQ